MKILCWNMGAAFGFKGAKHAAAWEWLNAQDADVAMLQEFVPREEYLDDWKSVAFAGKWQNWGSAVLVRDGGYEKWEPSEEQPWLQIVRGAVAVAKPVDGAGLWFASVHSDAWSFEKTAKKYKSTYQDLPPRDGILRSREKEMWEIEVIAHELKPLLAGKEFLFGGDLNSSLLFDKPGKPNEARLFENLATLGYTDIRRRHSADEVRTYFTPNNRQFMLDHLYADTKTEAAVKSWRVRTEVAADLGLSDHEPVEVVLET
jgi:hypothetical protein